MIFPSKTLLKSICGPSEMTLPSNTEMITKERLREANDNEGIDGKEKEATPEDRKRGG